MFIVASDLSEAQREIYEFLFSSGNECSRSVRTVLVELFCKLKSSMENPSLRVSGFVSSMNRTFIVEDNAEDDFGEWAKDDVTGEQGNNDDERSCFWTRDDTEGAWQSRPFKGRQMKRRKGKGKGKRQRTIPKRTGRAFSGDEQVQDPEWWSEQDFAWWSRGKERKARKACQKAMMSSEGWFSPLPTRQRCRQGFSPKTKAEEKIKKEKAKKERLPNLDCQPQKHPMKTIGLPIIGLPIPGLRLILHGWWQLHRNLPTIQHTLFWTLAAHGRENRDRQSKDSTSVHGFFWHYHGILPL